MQNRATLYSTAKMLSGLTGTCVSAVFPIDNSNHSIDRTLIFTVTAGVASKSVAQSHYPNPSSSEGLQFSIHGITSAFLYKLLPFAIPELDNTLTLFLLASFAPTLIATGINQTRSVASNMYSWCTHRPSSRYPGVHSAMDLENPESTRIVPNL